MVSGPSLRLSWIADHIVRWAPAIVHAAGGSGDADAIAASLHPPGQERMTLEQIVYWLRSAEDHLDPGRMISDHVKFSRLGDWNPALGKFIAYKSGFVLEAMIMSFELRSAAGLSASMTQAMRMLPAAWRSSLSALMSPPSSSSGVHVHGDAPSRHRHAVVSPSTLSRARLTVDVSYMLVMRARHDALVGSDALPVIYALVDSSPQGGRNWELTELQYITGPDLAPTAAAARQLMLHEVRTDADAELHDALTRQVGSAVSKHILPPASLGTRQTSLPMKLHCMIHSLRLGCSSWEVCSKLCSAVCAICSDMGTEMDVNRVEDVKINDTFWYWDPPLPVLADGGIGLDVADAPPSPLCVSFLRSLYVPGTYHLVDGVSKVLGCVDTCSLHLLHVSMVESLCQSHAHLHTHSPPLPHLRRHQPTPGTRAHPFHNPPAPPSPPPYFHHPPRPSPRYQCTRGSMLCGWVGGLARSHG